VALRRMPSAWADRAGRQGVRVGEIPGTEHVDHEQRRGACCPVLGERRFRRIRGHVLIGAVTRS